MPRHFLAATLVARRTAACVIEFWRARAISRWRDIGGAGHRPKLVLEEVLTSRFILFGW
jgi:hypothetical protein